MWASSGAFRLAKKKGNGMKFIDWFAGVGGFRKGMELAGHECVGFCEFDKFAVMSYTAMHPKRNTKRGVQKWRVVCR